MKGIAADPSGNLFVVDEIVPTTFGSGGGRNNGYIKKISPHGEVTTIPMTTPPPPGRTERGNTWLKHAKAIATDSAGGLFVSDWFGISKVAHDGLVTLITNDGREGGIVADATGTIYFTVGYVKFKSQ